MKTGADADSPDRRSPVEDGDVPVKSRLLKGLFLAFCCWHAVFLVISIIPGPRGWDESRNPALNLYELVLGGQQQWNLFFTIPVQHSFDARLEGEDEAGGRITAGCVLPGFKPYPKPHNSRYYVLFNQLIFSSNLTGYRDAYLRKAGQLLPAQRESGAGEHWALVLDAQYTRNLFYSRRGGQMSLPFRKVFDLPVQGENPQ